MMLLRGAIEQKGWYNGKIGQWSKGLGYALRDVLVVNYVYIT